MFLECGKFICNFPRSPRHPAFVHFYFSLNRACCGYCESSERREKGSCLCWFWDADAGGSRKLKINIMQYVLIIPVATPRICIHNFRSTYSELELNSTSSHKHNQAMNPWIWWFILFCVGNKFEFAFFRRSPPCSFSFSSTHSLTFAPF